MNRREALKQVVAVLGCAISAPTVEALLASEPAVAGAGRLSRQQLLTSEEDKLIAIIAEIILPTTDTPGARAARVDEFIRVMLDAYYPAAEQQKFIMGLRSVSERAQRLYGRAFLACTPRQQFELVARLDREAFGGQVPGGPDAAPDLEHWFRRMKELTLVGYYTSEIGATKELRVNPMGVYRGNIPYAEVGRSWS